VLRERVLSGVVLGIPVILMVVAGEWWMALLVFVVGCIALLEFSRLMARRGHRAFEGLMLGWMGLFVADRVFETAGLLAPGMAALLILTLAWSVLTYRRNPEKAVTGFAMTLAAGLYIGWVAAHFVTLRALQDGLFWTLSVVFAVWGTDTGAYIVGRIVGRRPMAPLISPRKTWEGYLGGVVIGTGIAAALPLGWQALGAGSAVTPLHGLVIGLMISVISPVGDVGMSMFKRYVNAKDSSRLIPGHGGVLDRIDSLLVAVLLGYYYIVLFAV
jgi:phosphatidate cytidylyltransferase